MSVCPLRHSDGKKLSEGQNETYAIEMCPSEGTGEAVSSMPLASDP